MSESYFTGFLAKISGMQVPGSRPGDPRPPAGAELLGHFEAGPFFHGTTNTYYGPGDVLSLEGRGTRHKKSKNYLYFANDPAVAQHFADLASERDGISKNTVYEIKPFGNYEYDPDSSAFSDKVFRTQDSMRVIRELSLEDRGMHRKAATELLSHFEAAVEPVFYHASDALYEPGHQLTGGHRLDDLYIADAPHVAASYYSSGHVYEVQPEGEPVPSREHEYTVPSARVVRRLPDAEVLAARQDAYNAPAEKALRKLRNDAQAEHQRRSCEDRWYRFYEGPDKPTDEESARHALEEQEKGRHEAATRPSRSEEQCSCCRGQGSHPDGSSCDRCGGTGFTDRGLKDPHCPGQPQPRRRRRRQASVSGPEHETWYHLTDNPHFRLSSDHEPEDNALSIEDRSGRKGIYLASNPETWVNGHGYVRPYVAEFHADLALNKGEVPGVHGRWRGEMFVPAEHFGKIRLNRVIPLDAHAREKYGEYGWIEQHHETKFDTGEPIPQHKWNESQAECRQHRPPEGYRYSGPDVREMTPEQHARHRDRWLAYMQGNRGWNSERAAEAAGQHDSHRREAVAHPGPGEKVCKCCMGRGGHDDGSECDPCDGFGLMHADEPDWYCPGALQSRRPRRHHAAFEDASPQARERRRERAEAWVDRHTDHGYVHLPAHWGPHVSNQEIHHILDTHGWPSDESDREDHWGHIETENFSLDQPVHHHQPFAYPDAVKSKMAWMTEGAEPWDSEPAKVVRHDGKTYLLDGHHRYAAARLLGRGSIEAHVFDTARPETYPANCPECSESPAHEGSLQACEASVEGGPDFRDYLGNHCVVCGRQVRHHPRKGFVHNSGFDHDHPAVASDPEDKSPPRRLLYGGTHCLMCHEPVQISLNHLHTATGGWSHRDGMRRDHPAIPADPQAVYDAIPAMQAREDQARMQVRDQLARQGLPPREPRDGMPPDPFGKEAGKASSLQAEGSVPEPDYDPSDELPTGRGIWYRVHTRGKPLDEAHARSRPLSPDQAKTPSQNAVGLRGYSAFASPHHLSQYMDEYGWLGEPGWGHREVIAFHGHQAGRGEDNEALVIPRASPRCCGRVIHSAMPWREFEDRIWGENTPASLPPKPWDSVHQYEGSPRQKSVSRHYRDETRRVLRSKGRTAMEEPESRELLGHFEAAAELGELIDIYHHTEPKAAQEIWRTREFIPGQDEDRVYGTSLPPGTAEGQTGPEYGSAAVHLRMPSHLVNQWPGPPGEREHYYDVAADDIRPEHFAGIINADTPCLSEHTDESELLGHFEAASPQEYGMEHRPDPSGPPLHDLLEGGMMPSDFYERMHEYNLYSHDPGLQGEAGWKAMSKIRKFRGQPDKKVLIWRSAPAVNPESRNAKRGEINHGDWVGLSREKALHESYEVNDPPSGSLPGSHPKRYHIWSARVPAKHVRNPDGDLTEWGYFGPDIKDIPHSSEVCSHRPGVSPREAAARPPRRPAEQEHTAGRQREGDERPYGGYTMRYRTEDYGERRPRHIIETFHRDGSPIGRMTWHGTTGKLLRIDVASAQDHTREPSGPDWGNGQNHRKQGIATAMWDWSQEMRPRAKHSDDLTADGRRWVQSLDKSRRDPPPLAERIAAQEHDELPPDPGTAPIPGGHVRLWHYTPAGNAASIREKGLKYEYARGDAGDYNPADPSRGIWASTEAPDELLRTPESGKVVVEYHAHPDDISEQAESPWMSRNHDRTWDLGKLRDWASGRHHVIMRGDVHPGNIIAIHEPWHAAARYMRQDDLASYQWIKEQDPHDEVYAPYQRALKVLERQQRTAAVEASAENEKPVRVHRGLYFGEGSAKDADELHRNPHKHLETENGVGIHWTDDEGSAFNFAQDKDPDGWAHEHMGEEEEEPGHRLGIVLHGLVHPRHIVEPGTEEYEGYEMADAVLGHDHPEREITLREGAPVRITHITSTSLDPEGNERNRERSYGREHLAAMVPGMEVIAHFAVSPAGPHLQQKLFDLKHQRQPCPDCGWQLGSHDPELTAAHRRHVLGREYEPDECGHCGADLSFPRAHDEAHEDWLREQPWYTDWSAEQPGPILHRGLAVSLPADAHARVHDESVPPDERARHLAGHILGHPDIVHHGFGPYWSDDPDVSKNYAESTRVPSRYLLSDQMPVMLHVRNPGLEHIETDPDELAHLGVMSYHLGGNREVPLKPDAPLEVTGISWAPPHHGLHAAGYSSGIPDRLEDDPAWRHHEFAEPLRTHAALEKTAADEDDDEWERRVIPPYSGEKLFHGSRSVLHPGDVLAGGQPDESRNSTEPSEAPYVFATTRGSEAHEWGERADSHRAKRRAISLGRQLPDRGSDDATYRPRVYEVQATGPVEPDPYKEGMSYRSGHPMRVIGEVHPLTCWHPDHEGEEHWPDHEHYAFLKQEQQEEEGEEEEEGRAKHTAAAGLIAHFATREHPHRDPPSLTAADRERLDRMGDDEADRLDPASDEHEYVWGFRNDRPHEAMRQHQAEATANRDDLQQDAAGRGHDMRWEHGEKWGVPGYVQHWEGNCAHCGANMIVADSSSSSVKLRDACSGQCPGPGTAWQSAMQEELAHERFNKAVSDYGQGVKDNLDRLWLREHGLEPHSGVHMNRGDRIDPLDVAQHMVGSGELHPKDAQDLQDVINHIRRSAPQSEPINERDAETIARSFRGRDRMRDAGFQIAPHSEESKYPRGFGLSLTEGHWLHLVPERHEEGTNWYARIDHPKMLMAPKIEHTIRCADHELPGAVRKFLDDPAIRAEMDHQRDEGIRIHQEIQRENEELGLRQASEHTGELTPGPQAKSVREGEAAPERMIVAASVTDAVTPGSAAAALARPSPWHVRNNEEAFRLLTQIHGFCSTAGDSLQALAGRLSADHPLDPAIPQIIAEMAASCRRAADSTADIVARCRREADPEGTWEAPKA